MIEKKNMLNSNNDKTSTALLISPPNEDEEPSQRLNASIKSLSIQDNNTNQDGVNQKPNEENQNNETDLDENIEALDSIILSTEVSFWGANSPFVLQ